MQQINSNVKVLGEITAKAYDQKNLSFFEKKFNKILKRIKPLIGFENFFKFYRFGKLKMLDEHKNVICKVGFNTITRLLVGDTTYSGEINKALLGTGVVGIASAEDIALENEIYRNDIASAMASSNVAFLTAFFTETECSGTYTEFGNCIDGSTNVDTGRLWSHLKGLNWVKDSSTVLVVSCRYTFASV